MHDTAVMGLDYAACLPETADLVRISRMIKVGS